MRLRSHSACQMCLSPWAVSGISGCLCSSYGARDVAGKNWRNLIVLAMLGVFIIGNAIFHWEGGRGSITRPRAMALRLGLARGNDDDGSDRRADRALLYPQLAWVKTAQCRLPVAPMQPFHKGALATLLVALVLWVPAFRDADRVSTSAGVACCMPLRPGPLARAPDLCLSHW